MILKKNIFILCYCFQVHIIFGQVIPTNEWINIWSDSTFLNGSPVQSGDVITIFDPQGILCGSGSAIQSGTFPLISVYRDDPLTPATDEGANPGDQLLFRINGTPANPLGPDNATWSAHGDIKQIHLSAASTIPHIDNLNASRTGAHILLEWSEISGANEYNIYRSANPNFSPDLVTGTNRIATMVTDEDTLTPKIQWTDTGAGIQLIGDLDNNYFYRVTGFAVGIASFPNHPVIQNGTQGIPHVALGQVYNADLSIPADGQIQFQASMLDRPGEVLTESSTGCGYTSGYWNVAVGNFPTPWSVGDTLYVQLINPVNGQSGSVLVGMTSSGSDPGDDVILSTLIESYPSNIAGEFDFQLITTAGTDINEIVMAMDTRLSRNSCQTAEELANMIPYCSVVYYWDPAGQGAIGHPKGLPFNDFPVYQGYPYMVNVTKDTIWTITGGIPDTTFSLLTTAGTDVNHVAVPFLKSHLSNAETLVQDIPNGTVVYQWDASGQGSIGHPIGLPFNNFDIACAHAYYVNITSDCDWPVAVSGGLSKNINNHGLTIQGQSNIPHLVFGKINISPKSAIDPKTLNFRAWVGSRKDDSLTKTSLGAGIELPYWFINIGNLKTPWQSGESLTIVLHEKDGEIQAEKQICLTNDGFDEIEGILIRDISQQDIKIQLPTTPELYHNFPNPFNHQTEIRYYITNPGNINLQIFNSRGSLVKEYKTSHLSSGYYSYNWDGTNNQDEIVVSGLYIYRLKIEDQSFMKKMILMK